MLLIGIAVYHAMQVHDEIMDELADTLLVSDLSANSGQLDELSNEFDIQYQLNWQGRTLAHSTHLQQQLLTTCHKILDWSGKMVTCGVAIRRRLTMNS